MAERILVYIWTSPRGKELPMTETQNQNVSAVTFVQNKGFFTTVELVAQFFVCGLPFTLRSLNLILQESSDRMVFFAGSWCTVTKLSLSYGTRPKLHIVRRAKTIIFRFKKLAWLVYKTKSELR